MPRASGGIRIEVPGRPPTINALRKMSRAEHRRVARDSKEAAAAAVGRLGPPPDPIGRFHAAAWMVAPDRRSWPDADNLATAAKWAVDELVRAGWLTGDGPDEMLSMRLWRPRLRPDAGHGLVVKIVPAHGQVR